MYLSKSVFHFYLSRNIYFLLSGILAEILIPQVISMNSYYAGHILQISYVYHLKMPVELTPYNSFSSYLYQIQIDYMSNPQITNSHLSTKFIANYKMICGQPIFFYIVFNCILTLYIYQQNTYTA